MRATSFFAHSAARREALTKRREEPMTVFIQDTVSQSQGMHTVRADVRSLPPQQTCRTRRPRRSGRCPPCSQPARAAAPPSSSPSRTMTRLTSSSVPSSRPLARLRRSASAVVRGPPSRPLPHTRSPPPCDGRARARASAHDLTTAAAPDPRRASSPPSALRSVAEDAPLRRAGRRHLRAGGPGPGEPDVRVHHDDAQARLEAHRRPRPAARRRPVGAYPLRH